MKFNRKAFFDGFRAKIDETVSQEQVDGLEFLLKGFETDPHWKDLRHIAYALATTYHETAGSFQPVEEGYYLGSASRVKAFQKTLRYYPYFGRGYVQLTWETRKIPNYSKASKALGIDFVKKPDLVMVPENAFKILTLGMFEGWFTSRKLTDYINDVQKDYKNARKIINGLDKAGLIAGYAETFEDILRKAAKSANTSAVASPSSENNENPTVIPQVAAEAPPIDSGTNETGVGAKIELTSEGIKAETTGGTSQNVVIEKRKEIGFFESMWKKLTGLSIFNAGLDGVTERAQQVQALGLSGDFWKRIAYLALAGTVIYLLFEVYKHFSRIKEEKARDEILARENSTPGNFVQFAPTEYLQEYRARGYKVITR